MYQDQPRRSTNQTLPWTEKVPLAHYYAVTAEHTSGPSISCEILNPVGVVEVRKTQTSMNAAVICLYPPSSG